MKRVLLLLYMPLVAFFASCSTDVNIYADYKEFPIIYGVLDANADTNFIKITRSFYVQGDPYESALNPDSSNYPGKLDVRIVEYCNGDSVREFILDTITIRDKSQGLFYAPLQKMYYMTDRLPINNDTKKYSYKLKVALPEFTLTTKTNLVGDRYFNVQSLGVNFSKQYIDAIPSISFFDLPSMRPTMISILPLISKNNAHLTAIPCLVPCVGISERMKTMTCHSVWITVFMCSIIGRKLFMRN